MLMDDMVAGGEPTKPGSPNTGGKGYLPLQTCRNKVVKVYYHRFEIEEIFIGIKHIWEYKRTRLRKPNNLKILLWFVCHGIALLYLATKPTKQQLYSGNTKKQTSWLRQAYEQVQRACGSLVWTQRSGG